MTLHDRTPEESVEARDHAQDWHALADRVGAIEANVE
jgi:hypothetical protein